MFDEQLLIDRIVAQTGYATALTHDSVVNTIALVTSPKVYVGHRGIKLQDPNMMYANGYSELDNPEVIITCIQILCPRNQWYTVRQAVHNAYKGWSPIDNADFSSMFFMEGYILAAVENNVMYEELVGLMFL